MTLFLWCSRRCEPREKTVGGRSSPKSSWIVTPFRQWHSMDSLSSPMSRFCFTCTASVRVRSSPSVGIQRQRAMARSRYFCPDGAEPTQQNCRNNLPTALYSRLDAESARSGCLWMVLPSTQADSHNSICFGGRSWGAYLRRKDRANSFANRESSSVLIITHVSKHNEVSESGFTTTPSA